MGRRPAIADVRLIGHRLRKRVNPSARVDLHLLLRSSTSFAKTEAAWECTRGDAFVSAGVRQ